MTVILGIYNPYGNDGVKNPGGRIATVSVFCSTCNKKLQVFEGYDRDCRQRNNTNLHNDYKAIVHRSRWTIKGENTLNERFYCPEHGDQ